MFSRLLNVFWIAWAIFGMVISFRASVCALSIPTVYRVCLIMSILYSILVVLPVLLCCVFIPVYAGAYFCCPTLLAIQRIRKASPRLIKKVTKVVKFSEAQIPVEDACCAICLCEYSNEEELRILNCRHHFHKECVTDWLMLNRLCPFCKVDIETKPLDVVLEEHMPLTQNRT